MKTITENFFNKVFEEVAIEYTKNRFMSEEEFEDLKKCFLGVIDEKIIGENFAENRIALSLTDI